MKKLTLIDPCREAVWIKFEDVKSWCEDLEFSYIGFQYDNITNEQIDIAINDDDVLS